MEANETRKCLVTDIHLNKKDKENMHFFFHIHMGHKVFSSSMFLS